MNFIKDFILYNVQDYIYNIRTLSENIKGETIHRMYRNHDYFGDGSVNDTWRPLTIQTIWCSFFERKKVVFSSFGDHLINIWEKWID